MRLPTRFDNPRDARGAFPRTNDKMIQSEDKSKAEDVTHCCSPIDNYRILHSSRK